MTVPLDEDLENQTEILFDTDKPWDAFLQDVLDIYLMNENAVLRSSALKGLAAKVDAASQDLSEAHIELIIVSLFRTLSLYRDKPSLKASHLVLKTLLSKTKAGTIKWETVFLKKFVKLAEREMKPLLYRLEPSTVLQFISFTSYILHYLISKENVSVKDMSESFALRGVMALYAYALDALSQYQDAKRLYEKAKRLTMSMLRANKGNGYELIFSFVLKAANDGHAFLAPLLGCCVEYTLSSQQELTSKQQEDIVAFYTKSILSSKTTAPESHLLAFSSFFTKYLTEKMFVEGILSTGERMLLRSPEVVLKVFDSLFSAVSFDCSVYFKTKFAESIFNNLKSVNESVRHDASSLFKSLSSKSSLGSEVADIVDIAAKAITAKAPSIDQRLLMYSALSNLPTYPETSVKVIEVLPTLAAKETNENVHSSCMAILGKHIQFYLSPQNSSVDDAFIQKTLVPLLTKGLSEKKHYIRKGFVGCVWTSSTQETALDRLGADAVQAIAVSLCDVTEKIQNAGIAVLDPKKDTPILVEGFFAIHWLLCALKWERTQSLNTIAGATEKKLMPHIFNAPSKSFIFNEKLYTKLISKEDQQPLLSLLFEIMTDDTLFDMVKVEGTSYLAHMLTYCGITSSCFDIRKETYSRIQAHSNNQHSLIRRFTDLIVMGLESYPFPDASSALPEDKLAWTNKAVRCSKELGARVYGLIQSVIPQAPTPVDQSLIEACLCDMVQLACDARVADVFGNDAWIRLCFKSGLNPKQVVEKNAAQIFQIWLKKTGQDCNVQDYMVSQHPVSDSQLRVTALFTSVAPNTVVPVLFGWLSDVFSQYTKESIKKEDIEIWQTPDGELYFDPTKKKGSSDGPKTADEKWDAKVRQELQSKRGTAPASRPKSAAGPKGNAAAANKQSKAEKDMIQQQLIKEASVRAHVQSVYNLMTSALELIESMIGGLASSLDSDTRHVIRTFMSKWVDLVLFHLVFKEYRENEVVFVGERAIQVYVKLGSLVEDRLQGLVHPRPSLAMTVLRVVGVKEGQEGIPKIYTNSPIATNISNILNAIKSLFTPSHPLSVDAFSFVFPLLYCLLDKEIRRVTLTERQIVDLSMSAADILLVHSALGSHPGMARDQFAKCLVLLIGSFARLHKSGKDGLVLFSAAVGEAVERSMDQEETSVDSLVHVLLDGLLNSEVVVREASIQSLEYLPISSAVKSTFDVRLWICKHDESEEVAEEADKVWSAVNGQEGITEDAINNVIDLAVHGVSAIRTAAGKAICSIFKIHPAIKNTTLKTLYELYAQKAAPIVPEYDEYGMVIPSSIDKKDDWEGRAGIAAVIKYSAQVIDQPSDLFSFFIHYEALGDKHEQVRKLMLEAALASIHAHGKTHVQQLIQVFDKYLCLPDKKSDVHDRIRENVVILMGNLAQHLDPTKSTIPDIINKLMDTLHTPSEPVQMAVSDCLPPLIKMVPDVTEKLLDKLLDQVFTAPKYAARRGAAYGLAGIVKGKGISALKEFSVMSKLKEAVEDKKNSQKREGALCCYETLSYSLGRLFEPYVIQILPLLLACYGDPAKEVREATDDACRVIMSKLSGHCVKLVLPSLLQGLETDNWRTKMGSVEVLGSMAFLAPKQLSLSLPQVVPRLTEALADSHARVQNAAQTALNNFGQVIKNPEIQALVPTLIQALVDPNNKTNTALVALLETAFVHYIDAPSLALVVPILQRGLKERSTDVKKRSAQIMGNMASLTDQKDLTPYLDTLLPGLKDVLVDPVPEARATAAKALGLMVERLGEESFPGLIAELLATLKSDTSAVDRSGASQGLSEIIAGLGTDRLEGLLPEIILNMDSNKGYIREGFMTLLVYLPVTYGDRFQPYLGQIIPPILRGLADESEAVRDSALKAAQMIARNYASTAIDLLLPELERGLFDENWRIRQSSLQLMGDLLYRITGVSSKNELKEDEAEEDGIPHAESGKKALINALGLERAQSILASIYIIRSDSNGIVRQASLHVWKSIISNTPRTLKEILPVMMSQLIASLASESLDKRGVAARTLGELVRKLGESVLSEIVPLLEKGLESTHADTRQGVCVGMSEIMTAAGKQQVQEFTLQCIPSIRKALIDEEREVREAAAHAFDELHQHLGAKAVDEVVPYLLDALKQDSHAPSANRNNALEALKELMSVRSNVVFPVLIPNLITTPISVFNARALSSLISVAGNALNRRLGIILPPLVDGLEQNDDAVEHIKEALRTLVVSVTEDGIHMLMSLLFEFVSEGTPARRRSACEVVAILFSQNKSDMSSYVGDWISRMMSLFKISEKDSVDADTVHSAWSALDAVTKSIKKDDMDKYVSLCRKSIASLTEHLDQDDMVDGFNLPKGLSAILPIFLQGLMYGGTDTRASSALGLGEVIQRTSADALKPCVTQMTGPLIRVMGDRFPSNVKSAILQTLGLLLDKVPHLLKPFLPQLQRTFIKSLSEPTAIVRDKAASCLSLLITLQTRLDPIVVELCQGIKSTEDKGIKDAMWTALYGLMKGVCDQKEKDISPPSRKLIEELVMDTLLLGGENDDTLRICASRVFGVYCDYIPLSDSKVLVGQLIKDVDTAWTRTHGVILGICALFGQGGRVVQENGVMDPVLNVVKACMKHDKAQIVEASVLTLDHVLSHQALDAALQGELVELLAQSLVPTQDAEVRRQTIVVLKHLAKCHYKMISNYLKLLVPNLMLCVRDRVIPIKLAAERAMLHLLQIGKDDTVLQTYLKTLEGSTARSVGEYVKKVLIKLADDESE